MDNQEAYNRAKKKLEAQRGFKVHLSVYILVSAFFITVNLLQDRNDLWFPWPMLGWGIGVLFHGLSVYVFSGMFAVTDEKIKKEMERESSGK